MIYRKYGKRIIDLILAIVGLIILSPLFLLIIILIKLDSKGPILFKQRRVGKGMKEFQILKFRTMKIETPKEVPTRFLYNPEAYITRMGKFLRKTSLDEIPQIINIIKGEMSIIGPRPVLWNEYELFAERDKYGANDIKPGLTGWAQINGRDIITTEIKALLDGEYIKKMSLLFDMEIFFLTIIKVIKSKGFKEGANMEISPDTSEPKKKLVQ